MNFIHERIVIKTIQPNFVNFISIHLKWENAPDLCDELSRPRAGHKIRSRNCVPQWLAVCVMAPKIIFEKEESNKDEISACYRK